MQIYANVEEIPTFVSFPFSVDDLYEGIGAEGASDTTNSCRWPEVSMLKGIKGRECCL